MKIYYFSGATLPSDAAKSVHVMKMCQALARQNKNSAVTLFAKSDIQDNEQEIFDYYGVDSVFSLALSRNVKIPGVSGLSRLFSDYFYLRELGDPGLAYGRDPIALSLLVPPEVPVMFEAHQMPYYLTHKLAIGALIKRDAFRGIVAISEALKADLLKVYPYLKRDNVLVAHDGADIPKEKPIPKELPGRENVLKVGYAGSLHPGKGAEILMNLSLAEPDFDFHIVGGTPEQVKILKARKLPQNLFIHGHVPHSELGSYLAAFDIVAAPYQGKAKIKTGQDISRWISPMKLFEYMAGKKPIVCSDLPVIREILKDGENALLVPPSDLVAWGAALNKLKQDKALQNSLASRAFSDLEKKYTWARRAASILAMANQKS